ncbi:MXAN_6640 family putative metalloprotease [Nocardioides sp. MH1]|uniref:MXAN_6640 family putative metalloprotease n=1 Tax=Nocardioides sp. MH1 TaxID=3242490 RepID=UPI003521E21D
MKRALVAVPLSLVFGLTLTSPSALADPPTDPGSKASLTGKAHRAERAQDALAAVRSILGGADQRRAGAADPRSLTIALRDLALYKDALSPADQRAASRALKRPGATKESCTKRICVHWVTSGASKPSLRDKNGNHVPDYVDQVRKTVDAIHLKYKKAGYRSPLPDQGRGGDNRTDVYIRDVGSQGIYGYCTTDDNRQRYDRWAYCVLDNNFSHAEFPTNTPLENMQVTAAHEYFHAVQYSYDFAEDPWILESTATWAEDEFFDKVDDNRQYLSRSPMSDPEGPLDMFAPVDGDDYSYPALFQYGTWIFWRYLTEHYPASSAGLPTLVRDVWRLLDAKKGAPDKYSLQGLEKVLQARGTNLPKELSLFADANRHPADVYEEGATYTHEVPLPAATRTLNASGASATGPVTLDHLASATVRFVPGGSLDPSAELNLSINLPGGTIRSQAVVTRFLEDGTTQTQRVVLDANGDGVATSLQFSPLATQYVEVTLVNASNETTCWTADSYPIFSCQGTGQEDGQAGSVTGTALVS